MVQTLFKTILRNKVLVAFLSFSVLITVETKGVPVFYSYGETFKKVLDLPIENELEYNGRTYHVDLGVKFQQISIFWIPLFNYGEKEYVFVNKALDVYWELNDDGLDILQEMYGSSVVPSKPKLPFWDAWGGKMVLILINIAWYGISRYLRGDENDSTLQEENS